MVRSFGEFGNGVGHFKSPVGATVDAQGLVYVTDTRAHGVLVFTAAGQFVRRCVVQRVFEIRPMEIRKEVPLKSR